MFWDKNVPSLGGFRKVCGESSYIKNVSRPPRTANVVTKKTCTKPVQNLFFGTGLVQVFFDENIQHLLKGRGYGQNEKVLPSVDLAFRAGSLLFFVLIFVASGTFRWAPYSVFSKTKKHTKRTYFMF